MGAPGVLAAVTVAGTALSIGAQLKRGQAESEAAKQNALLIQQQRSDALRLGASDARRAEIEGRKVAGGAKTAIAKNGIELSGSASNLVSASEASAQADAATARANAARKAFGLDIEEDNVRRRGAAARQAGVLGSLGTGLSAIGKVGSFYVSESKKGGST